MPMSETVGGLSGTRRTRKGVSPRLATPFSDSRAMANEVSVSMVNCSEPRVRVRSQRISMRRSANSANPERTGSVAVNSRRTRVPATPFNSR